jgi:hypothetical protein
MFPLIFKSKEMLKFDDSSAAFVQLQKNCTTAIKFHNCKKNVQLLFQFTTAKFYVGIIERNAQLLFHFTTAKKLYNCKTNAQQQKKCTTAKQIYCNTRRHSRIFYVGNDNTSVIFPTVGFTFFPYIVGLVCKNPLFVECTRYRVTMYCFFM